jgi:heat-inducible transcriptional repressor
MRLAHEVLAAARAVGEETPMYVEGAHAALEHPEFRDVERLGQFLSTLQERAALIEMMRQALDARTERVNEVRVVIGEEHARPDLHEYSMVSSAYFVGARERGTIGVLGPTRMDYGRAAAAVRFMARTVSDLLTQLSVAR